MSKRLNIDSAELQWLEDELIAKADQADESVDQDSAGEESGQRKTQSQIIVELAADAELFHDPNGETFARFEVDSHREIAKIRTRPFRRWLIKRYYDSTNGRAPGSQALQEAIGTLESRACFSGDCRDTYVRTAESDGRMYIDLCNATWQAVEIDASGWRIVDEVPVMFRRAKGMLPLPIPEAGGSIGDLRHFINVTDAQWPLIPAWLLAALCHRGAYPVLCLAGEQGSAKTTVARILRSLVDPSTAPLRSEPREPRDLMIAATNSHVIALDNLSRLREWLSDALCRLSTGGGLTTRTLYSDDEETIFDAIRPIILTGIEDLPSRGDLIGRSLMIVLPPIEDENRKLESDLWQQFEQVRPKIFGALLDAVSTAIRRLPSIRLEQLPRMADFALWATAAEPALGLVDGAFLKAYSSNVDEAVETALEASPVGRAIIGLMQDAPEWSGTAEALLGALSEREEDRTRSVPSWPKTPKAMGGAVRRLAPTLRKSGVEVEFQREKVGRRRRLIRLSNRPRTDGTRPTCPDPSEEAVDLPSGHVGTHGTHPAHPYSKSVSLYTSATDELSGEEEGEWTL